MSVRNQFTPEFKREAVQLVESGSRPTSAIARELGVRRNQLYKWQTELRACGSMAFPGPGARKERTTEVARLTRELARVTEERDIVQKAAVGAGPPTGDTRHPQSPQSTVGRVGEESRVGGRSDVRAHAYGPAHRRRVVPGVPD